MIIYTDQLTGDEMVSDAYKVRRHSFPAPGTTGLTRFGQVETVDDVLYEVNSANITIKEGEVDIGANASAEEASEALEDGAVTVRTLPTCVRVLFVILTLGIHQVNNIVHSFRLSTTTFDKKGYMTYLKGYMKAVKEKLQETDPDRVPAFEKGAQAAAKKILGNFKDYEFFTGESMNPDGCVMDFLKTSGRGHF